MSCRRPSARDGQRSRHGEDAGDEGKALARCLKRQLAAVAVLEIGTVNADGEEPTIGVCQDMLASGDLLARVIALVAPF